MIYDRYSKYSLYLFFLLNWLILIASCTMNTQEASTDSSLSTSTIVTQTIQNTGDMPTPVFIMTSTPTIVTVNVEETVTQTPIIAAKSTEQSTPTATPWSTATSSSSATSTPDPSPTTVLAKCKNTSILPEQILPTSVNMDSAHIAMSEDHLYLAVEQYIGMFEISDPELPEFLGFWHFPDMPNISDIVVSNGLVYIASGSTIQALNASPECQFEIIAHLSIHLQIFRLKTEGERLYAGGATEDGERREVVILSLDKLSYLEELGVVYLGDEPTTWSIFEEALYSLSPNRLAVTDVANPATSRAQPVSLTLDSEVLRYTPALFNKNTLYMLWGSDILTIISNLEGTSPTVTRRDDTRYLLIDVFQVQEKYIFLGINSCDVECASAAWILDADNGQEVSSVSLHPHYPVYDYQEIAEHLIYAFSDNTLVVVDISNNPTILNEVQFIK